MADCKFHLQTREIGERRLGVIDELFQPDFIYLLETFLKRLPFSLADYDAEGTRHVLHWIHEFSVEDANSHPLLSALYSGIQCAWDSLGWNVAISLRRIHCNAALYGDIQFPHHDLTPGVTWLYFANSVWNPNWMGETVFYDGNEEPFLAVLPRPGRVVIFPADILHRGGVPSRECVEARRSIAFKFIAEDR